MTTEEIKIESVLKVRDWVIDAIHELSIAGCGSPEHIIKKIPSDVLWVLVTNNLKLKYIATKES